MTPFAVPIDAMGALNAAEIDMIFSASPKRATSASLHALKTEPGHSLRADHCTMFSHSLGRFRTIARSPDLALRPFVAGPIFTMRGDRRTSEFANVRANVTRPPTRFHPEKHDAGSTGAVPAQLSALVGKDGRRRLDLPAHTRPRAPGNDDIDAPRYSGRGRCFL